MAENNLILVCKDKQIAEDFCRILTATGKIDRDGIEVWDEKTWDAKRKTGPYKTRMLLSATSGTRSLWDALSISATSDGAYATE